MTILTHHPQTGQTRLAGHTSTPRTPPAESPCPQSPTPAPPPRDPGAAPAGRGSARARARWSAPFSRLKSRIRQIWSSKLKWNARVLWSRLIRNCRTLDRDLCIWLILSEVMIFWVVCKSLGLFHSFYLLKMKNENKINNIDVIILHEKASILPWI